MNLNDLGGVNVKNRNGKTMIQSAVMEEQFEILQYLTEQKADLTVVDSSGKTLLHEVIELKID